MCIGRVVLAAALCLASVAQGQVTRANPPRMKTFDLDGRKIRYLDVGKGKVVMLLHGFACDHTDWRHQIAALAEGYRVIAPDLAFFGQSDPGERPHTTINHAKDCSALLDHLSIQKAVVVGHSMGGWIARDIYLQAPQRVAAIVEIDNTAIAPALDQLPKLLGVKRPSGQEYSSAVNDQRRQQYLSRRAEMKNQFGGKNPKAAYRPSPAGNWCHVPVLAIWTSRGAFSQQDIPRDTLRSSRAAARSSHWCEMDYRSVPDNERW